MGSLTSGPKLPAPQPQQVFVPQPSSAPSTPAPAQTPSETAQEAQQETDTEIRRQNLLGRERSRFGTVQTSFRGLLGLAENAPQRKTLLGE